MRNKVRLSPSLLVKTKVINEIKDYGILINRRVS